MGNYKRTKPKYEEDEITMSYPMIIMLTTSIGLFSGSFLGNTTIGLIGGLAVGIPFGLWIDGDKIKEKRAKKQADKLAVEREAARREKIRQERKNK